MHPIAVRRAIDHLRSRQRWFSRFLPLLGQGEEPGGAGGIEPASDSDPRQEMEKSESADRFERALASLPPKHRAVIALREIQGLSYDEIAQTLGCRRGTVMSRLFNARRRPAKKLKDLP